MSEEPLTLGVTYWARRTGLRMWEAYDRSATRDELAHLAALGCNAVRLVLRWEDVQPRSEKLNPVALRAFEHTLDAAADAGLAATTVLLPVTIAGGLHLPPWLISADPLALLRQLDARGALPTLPSDRPPLVSEWRTQPNHAPNLFDDTDTRDKQRLLVRELLGNFASHPAAAAWQLGDGLEYVVPPASRQQSRDWLSALVETARATASQARLSAGVSPRGVLNGAGPRPEDAAQLAGMAVLNAAVLPPWLPQRTTPDALLFMHALASGLAEQPVAVAGVGTGSAPEGRQAAVADAAYGRARSTTLVRPQEQADYVAAALDGLWRAGAPAIWLAAYADFPADTWRVPPLDQAVGMRAQGLVDGAGNEKPAAEAVRSFMQQARGRQQPASTLHVDPERYWHAPQQEIERLWREFDQR